jgi:crotonobetainyl-CoA:carnitine CoA-transferase CaiB-like acyl-CoA transferase
MTANPPAGPGALGRFRICDFTGQLAGAGATKWLAAFGAEVIRIEDPVTHGLWDILRPMGPFVDERRGPDFGGGFNNHNPEKYGITLNLRTERAKELLVEIVKRSDVVSENFAKGVLERWGFGYERLRQIKPDIIYVSNCGFGHRGPYSDYKTWGPIVQAMSGLTFLSGRADAEPAGWGYSYMDHTGGMYMAIAILLALVHRERTGEGQWVDMSCTDSGLTLTGTSLLDYAVNGRPARRPGAPDSNHSTSPEMAPHAVYPARATTSGSRSPAATTPTGSGSRSRSAPTGVGTRVIRPYRAALPHSRRSTPRSGTGRVRRRRARSRARSRRQGSRPPRSRSPRSASTGIRTRRRSGSGRR